MYSILDTDLYKFSTSYAYMKMFPDAECTFTFVDRNKVKRSDEFLKFYKLALKGIQDLHLTDEEFNWCVQHIPYIPQYYWEWLKSFRYEADKINVYLDEESVLHVDVTDKCYKCSLYEIPCLYLVTEISNYFNEVHGRKIDLKEDIISRLAKKIEFANIRNIKFSEFGTRRRYNYEVQDNVIEYIKEHSTTCVGTSNVHFAMKYDMVPCGTHPHEWFMFHASQFGYKNANYLALENWVNVYDGALGTALTDTFTSDVFFHNFSLKQAKLFDGIRQDSGNEYEFIRKALAFYNSKKIDPTTKTIIFSNGLDFKKAEEINEFCKGKIRAAFGIGTNLTNDTGYPAENIVMKMTRARMNASQPWYECIKISDDLGKHLGSDKEVNHAMYELGL